MYQYSTEDEILAAMKTLKVGESMTFLEESSFPLILRKQPTPRAAEALKSPGKLGKFRKKRRGYKACPPDTLDRVSDS